MNKQSFKCSIAANVSAQEAQAAIANVSGWWAKHTEGDTTKEGAVFTVRFGDTFVTFKITEWEPAKRTVWHVTNCYLPWLKDKTEWNDTSVVWEISEADGVAHIQMTHDGLVPAFECYGACQAGWGQHVQGSLLKLLTDKVGSPT